MNRTEAIEYLTRCADDRGNHWDGGRIVDAQSCPTCHGSNDAGHLAVPGGRYGSTSAQCAPMAYRVARIMARDSGDELTSETLDYVMGLVVNSADDIAQTLEDYAVSLSGADLDAMVQGYLEAQLWTQSNNDRDDSGSIMLDANYGVDDVSPEYVDKIRTEFSALVQAHPLAVRMFLNTVGRYESGRSQYDRNELFGHDFLLTREGHGAGFWDRGLGELGDYLTDIAKYAGSADDLWDNGSGVLS